MIDAMKSRGISVYADIVLNHMANEYQSRGWDLSYPGAAVLSDYANRWDYYQSQKLYNSDGDDLDKNFLGSGDFHDRQVIHDYNNTGQVQYGWLGAAGDNNNISDFGLPDLNDNSWVVSQQQQYLKALKAMGIKGFRIDAAKHMTEAQIKAIFTPEIIQGMYVFGEIISGNKSASDYHFLSDYLSQNPEHNAYDFPLFTIIKNTFSFSGKMSDLSDPDGLNKFRALTFVVTHDIPNNDIFRGNIMDPTDEKLGYAYILGRDGGVPMVYSDHGESNASHPEDNSRWVNYYNRSDIKAMIRFHNSVQGQPMTVVKASDCILLFRRGDQGLVGINKCGTAESGWVSGLDSNKGYQETLDDSTFYTDGNGGVNVTIPARSSRMWLEQ